MPPSHIETCPCRVRVTVNARKSHCNRCRYRALAAMETFDRDVAVSTVNFTCTTRSAVAPAAATEVSNAGLAVAVVVVAGVLVAGAAAAGGVVSPGVDEAQPIGSRWLADARMAARLGSQILTSPRDMKQ